MTTISASELVVNQKKSTVDSLLTISVDEQNPLSVGVYDFQLVVTDDSGNESIPATCKIVVVDNQAPTAVIDAPDRVGFGNDFALSGERSVDIGGQLTKFVWTLIKAP